jgi:hypothetical protein
MFRHRQVLPALIASCIAFSPLSAQIAQTGTITIGMHVKLPDSLKTPVPLTGGLDIQLTLLSDGHRVALDLTLGGNPALPMLEGARLHALYQPGTDTVHAGVLLPPALAGMANGAAGFRVDLPLTALDSMKRTASHVMDSIGTKLADSLRVKMPTVTYRSLGTTATVAGVRCEEWETVAGADTIDNCVIPTPAPIKAALDFIKQASGAQQMLDQVPGLAAATKAAYGGRDMMPIRSTNARTGMRMELLKYSSTPPDAALLDLPAGLQPLPSGMGNPFGGGKGAPGQ